MTTTPGTCSPVTAPSKANFRLCAEAVIKVVSDGSQNRDATS
jgi:hypothetical protein